MASSDDELESLPHSVSDFHFEDEGREPTSLSVLPLYWSEDEFSDGERKEIFLSGVADDGLQKIYKPVSAWKFSLSEQMPQISVLFKGNNWIKLQKPRKGYAEEIRAVLITISALHYLKNNPEASQIHLWDHLTKTFSTYEAGPSQDDLEDQLSLINESVKRDETLRKSKFLLSFLEERPQKRKAASKAAEISTKRAFIVDDDEMDVADDASDEEDDLFGSICAICDNGGELVCCDGQCMRSFHATIEAGAESSCRSLRFSDAQVKVMQSFICRNCKYNQHQCFCCGKLGSSDKASGAEVFRCVNATCGLFYHPRCVAKVLHPDAAAAEETRQKIATGESFTCPIHRCFVCQKLEDKNVSELQFAVCRRCPKSYHRKCLPSDISFEDEEDDDIIQRAWEGLMPKRILIYCLEHEIDEDLGTPVRDHVKFPPIKKNLVSMSLTGTESFRSRKGSPDVNEIASDKTFRKPSGQIEKPSSMMERAESFKRDKRRSVPTSLNKIMRNDPSMKPLHVDVKHAGKKVKSSTTEESGTSLGEQLYNMWREGSEAGKPRKLDTAAAASNKTIAPMPVKETLTSVLQLDKDSERRILDLMKQSTSSVSLEDIIKKHRTPSTHGSRNNVDRTITQGKIEGFVEAVRAAVQKLEKGRNIEDAKAVCEPEILQQIIRWKNKLKVYLAPFIHGMRYTSFGRHFTKVDKLKEIVDRLHWYAQPGDMIVDFCCGSNDFSCLMRNKLEETGKKCFYKNFDLLQPKHDFNFVRKDWMTVQPKELLVGSKLIMGLNPPFGLKACLANQFINKALEFKPKLIILIVPPETERLDNKRSPYNLVWEDNAKLSGKSFYLPGSVDVHDKQIEQWNATPPVLSLWSRPDWSNKHIAIAQEHKHIAISQEHDHLPRLQMEPSQLEEPQKGSPGLTLEDSRGRHRDSPMPTVDQHILIDDPKPDGSGAIASSDKDKDKESRPFKNENKGESDGSSRPKNMSNKYRRQKRKERGRVESDLSVPDNPSGMKRPRHDLPSPGKSDSRSTPMFNVSRSGSPEKLKPKSPLMEYEEEGFEHFQPSIQGYAEVSARSPVEEERFGHFQPSIRGYGEVSAPSPDDLVRRYGSNTREHYSSGMLGRSDPIGFRPYTMGDHSNILGQARHYGQQDSGSFSHLRSVSSYGRLGSSAEPHYMPTIHGYTPQLDELNRSRLNVPAPQLPKEPRGGSYYDPLLPPPRFGAGAHHPFPYSG